MSEALRLADELDADEWIAGTRQWREEAAAELRRLHELNIDATEIIAALGALNQKLLDVQQRHLTDEVIADLWHKNGGYHHHFARAIERWLKGQA
jgi:hypothetical protein